MSPSPASGQPSPLDAWNTLLEQGAIRPDADQEVIVAEFERLWHQLKQQSPERLLDRLRGRRQDRARGIYLWGSVGRGKTWLMDLFLESLQGLSTTRVHFHRFMARVHDDLVRFESARHPLKRIARSWAEDCDILCLDEFFVSDIADAMLLGGLLDALFEENVVLVATSNVHPDDLYRDGLQRARFLPAIERIKQNCQILKLKGSHDHRLRFLERAGVFHSGAAPENDTLMEQRFEGIAGGADQDPQFLINGRVVHARRRALGVLWVGFEELCEKPRSAIDYIEMARDFNTVLVSGLGPMGDTQADTARRFITLVDEFYDRNVKLIISASCPLDKIYTGERLAFEFQRTYSRLVEMQGHEYLARPHLP